MACRRPEKKVESSAGPAINESMQGSGQFTVNSLLGMPGQATKADVRIVTERGGKVAAVQFKDCTMGEPPVVVKARAKWTASQPIRSRGEGISRSLGESTASINPCKE